MLSWTLLDAGYHDRDTQKFPHLGLKNFTNRLGLGKERMNRDTCVAVDIY